MYLSKGGSQMSEPSTIGSTPGGPADQRRPPEPGPGGVLTREIMAPAAVVVLGAIMTIIDATIVNVALPTLGRALHTSITVIQWVPTVYLLAFASVIPLGGWAAGPQRMGRVMSIIGIPMLLAPIFGPLIGGSLIAAASWHWIFFVNLPVGLVAVALAVRLLPASGPRRPERLDVLGLVLLSGGLAVSLYGLAEAGQHARLAVSLGPVAAGAVLVALFAAHARRAPNPLIDVRLFARRGFGTAAAANFVLGVALFGVALLLPLYFEILRGRSPLETGVLLAPQGLGAACAISLAGFLTDKVGARWVVPFGVALALAGTAMYARIGVSTPYWSLALALFLVGAGLGATITPSMAAAFQDLPRAVMGHATSAINVVQRVAGSVGSALLAVVLQGSITGSLPGFRGGIGQAAALAGASPRAALAVSHAFAVSFGVALALSAVALVPAVLLPGRARGSHSEVSSSAERRH